MESRLLLLVALIFISPLHGWKITYLPLWTVFTVLWATLLRKKLCQFFLLVIPQKAEWINGFTSPSAEGSSNCLLPVPCAALRQEWSMKPSSWTALEKHHWLSQAENTENNHQHHLSGLCGFQREGDKHEQQEMKAIQWQSKPRRVLCFSIQPHLEPSCWNAVVEPVLLRIMARLCLCDAQVFGFYSCSLSTAGDFFFFFLKGLWTVVPKKERKHCAEAQSLPLMFSLPGWPFTSSDVSRGADVYNSGPFVLLRAPDTGLMEELLTLLVSQHWWSQCPHIKTLPELPATRWRT